ncbi:MAG: C40 family peptidase [Firmicutes bacterium]|nr:C40 family peptidase [Bacillota bacterium]MCM1400737.1 C40 family peptidase [Bacteroides sp.]MCM1476844.1 C40 family peptidase [Bacteroides sp.]
MTLRKIVISTIVCGIFMPVFTSAKSLPKEHLTIAREETQLSNENPSTSFVAMSMQQTRQQSPFAEMPEILQEEATDADSDASKLINYAQRFLGTRYVLGAMGPSAFDCSGFVGYVYRNFGIKLDRTSRQQYLQGDKVTLGNLQPGDLLFFSSRSSGRGNVGHVAMVTEVNPDGSCQFIHASSGKGKVTYQKFPDNGYYQRNFVGARRVLGTNLAQNSSLAQN